MVMLPLGFTQPQIELPLCGGQIHWSYVSNGHQGVDYKRRLTGISIYAIALPDICLRY